MRNILKVFGTIFLVSTILGCLMMFSEDATLAKNLANNGRLGLSNQVAAAGYVWLFTGLALIFGTVLLFINQHRLGWISSTGLLALLGFTVYFQPHYQFMTGNDPRVTGLGIGFFGVLGLLILLLVHTSVKPDAKLA